MGDHDANPAEGRFGFDPADYAFANAAAQYVRDTPRLAKYRKTIVNVAGVIVNVLMLVILVPTDVLPGDVAAPLALGIQGVTAALAYAFPNAITKDQADKLTGYIATTRR